MGDVRWDDYNFQKESYVSPLSIRPLSEACSPPVWCLAQDPWKAYGQSKTANIYMANVRL
jgi:hypothetical protein